MKTKNGKALHFEDGLDESMPSNFLRASEVDSACRKFFKSRGMKEKRHLSFGRNIAKSPK